MKYVISIIIQLIAVLMFSCNSNTKSASKDKSSQEYIAEDNQVSIMVLKKQPFCKEIISNGKLKALKKCNLRFEESGILKKINIQNGEYITKGAIIAQLKDIDAQQSLKTQLINLEKAKFSRKDILVGHGYDIENINNVPKQLLQVANIRSGYTETVNNIQIAQTKLENTILKAPFSGKIANLHISLFEHINANSNFCTLVDDSQFEVVFELMESEYNKVKIGQKVIINPFFSNKSYNGEIKEINPLIEANGMVKVKAIIHNSGDLADGMNVNILIKSKKKKQFIVPKSAVLERQNMKIIFRYKSGLAYWTYIKITNENSSSYAITGNKDRDNEIYEGDTVIVSGNENLANDSKVRITETNTK